MSRRNVYLDHSATTPTDQRVVEAMLPYFYEEFGNASSSHRLGQRAERAVEDARERIARILNCEPGEIVFTSGGTESDNLAVRGAAWSVKSIGAGSHLVTTAVEHPAVANTIAQLANVMGFERTILSVDAAGMVDPETLETALRPDTTLVSSIYASNEVGTVEPIQQLAAVAHEQGAIFHTDAVQAGGQLTLDVQQLGVDMLSLSAHKFYGPKGVGLLYVRDGIDLTPAQTGGNHENYRRSGTYNAPGIIGMATALELANQEREARVAHFEARRDQLIDSVLSSVPDVELTGHRTMRLPSHASFVINGVESNTLLMHLDVKGVMASSSSACKTGNPEPSDVLLAMGYSHEQALGSLRLTVGLTTTEEDVAYAVEAVGATVERVRKLHSQVTI